MAKNSHFIEKLTLCKKEVFFLHVKKNLSKNEKKRKENEKERRMLTPSKNQGLFMRLWLHYAKYTPEIIAFMATCFVLMR